MQGPQMASNIDPVCGMRTDTSIALKTNYNGSTYYFDTEECQKVFLKNPQKFAGMQMSGQHDHYTMMGMGGWMGGVAIATMAVLMSSMLLWHWR